VAGVIPDNLLTNTAVRRAHRRAAKALLVGLGDTATIWFEPPFQPADDARLPDFVVLDPSLGLVVATVFEHTEGEEVLGALRGELRVSEAGAETIRANPLERAESFVAELRAVFSADPLLSFVPVAGIAAFPYVQRAAAEELGFDTVVPLERCLFAEEIDAVIREDTAVSLQRILNRVLEGGVEDLIDDDTQSRIRAVIHPEVLIGAEPEQGSLFQPSDAETDVVRVMDLHQERFAKRLNHGHRVIRGVAGSGKTLILVTRARLLSRTNPAGEVLVTCFTKALASVLRAQLSSCPNVKVMTLDQLASELIQSAWLKHPGFRGTRTPYSVALDAIERRPPQRFRAVMVDEAQDFDDDALRLCVALTEPRADGTGDLLLVADAAQRIYDRSFTWSAAGIQARGRTSVLRVNYRNTQEVLAFASAFVDADTEADGMEVPVAARDDLDTDDEVVVVPAEASERHGDAPSVCFVNDLDAEIDAVVEAVSNWYSDRLPSRSIAVLMQSGTDGSRAERLVAALTARNVPAFWATESSESKGRVGMTEEAVIVSTIHSAKGLEFPRVVVCGLFQRGTGEWVSRNRNALYVGFTRAIDELAVIATSGSPYVAQLRQAAEAATVASLA